MNAILLWQWVVRERLGMVNIPKGMRGMPGGVEIHGFFGRGWLPTRTVGAELIF